MIMTDVELLEFTADPHALYESISRSQERLSEGYDKIGIFSLKLSREDINRYLNLCLTAGCVCHADAGYKMTDAVIAVAGNHPDVVDGRSAQVFLHKFNSPSIQRYSFLYTFALNFYCNQDTGKYGSVLNAKNITASSGRVPKSEGFLIRGGCVERPKQYLRLHKVDPPEIELKEWPLYLGVPVLRDFAKYHLSNDF